MENTKMPKSEVLTPDEVLVADFIKTRTKKVLDDIQKLSKEQNNDLSQWAESFAYLARTYGRDSDETFKWFKYYFREGLIPANVALPLVVQIYLDSSVDGGFVNTFARAFKQEPEEDKKQRIKGMKKELAEYLDDEGHLIVYRRSFERPFGREEDASRVIEKGFAFSLDREVAKNYAVCWFPETAKIYEVKAPLSDVAWYCNYDEEKTVILLPQNKGGQWAVASEEVVPKSEYGSDSEKAVAVQAYAATFKRK